MKMNSQLWRAKGKSGGNLNERKLRMQIKGILFKSQSTSKKV